MTDPAAPCEKILVITRNLPPLIGGMERLLVNTVRELQGVFDIAVIGPAGCEEPLSDLSHVVGKPPYPLWRFLLASLGCGILLARRTRPRIVFAGSGLTAPVAMIAARFCGAISVAQLHGLDLVARNPVYRFFFANSLRWLDAVIVNSHNTANLAAKKHIPPDRIHIVHPGVTMPDKVSARDNEDFLRRNGLHGKRVLLSVGRLTARKGISGFIKRCLSDIVRECPDTVLLVAGDVPSNALKTDNEEILEIKRAIEITGTSKHVRLLGAVSDEELDLCYRNSTVFVFPAIPVTGDVEGFGIVALEAAARGVPTVAFAEGGIVDAVDDGRSGRLVESGSYSCFTREVVSLLKNPGSLSAADCVHHAKQFDSRHFGQRLRSTFETILTSRQIGDGG